jgi:hypothetical protein
MLLVVRAYSKVVTVSAAEAQFILTVSKMKECRPLAESPPYYLGWIIKWQGAYGARSVSLLVWKGPDGPKPILLAWGRRTAGPMDGSC